MIIYIGADHKGFSLKQILKQYMVDLGYEVVDVGNVEYAQDDDYVDYAMAGVKTISQDPALGKGVLICGSGVGMAIAANKFRNIRASLCFSPDHAMVARAEDDANILVLPAEFIDEDTAKKITSVWFSTQFKNEERYQRRLKKLSELELKTTNYFE
ncbi:MAG: RpiB/LacA/LacB family sugar-phosphate isomerase [Candidatus Pacebacteria bacterium]|nr:RpiB/LacA/LacB family sugar-phosphate isomerase [Candidatus Paceibacterota bacterium]